jgi:hypothetical protein
MKCDRFIIRLKSSFRLRAYTFNYRKVKIELRLSIADTLPYVVCLLIQLKYMEIFTKALEVDI